LTAPVVKRIYELYLSGAGYKQIATVLTNEGIPSPSAHDRIRNSDPPWVRWTLRRFDVSGTGWSRLGAVCTTRGAL
jgi:hypothetical protein